MIFRLEHPDPDAAWATLRKFMATYGKVDGEPLTDNLQKVIMLGVWLGCRYAMLWEPMALALAAKGNSFDAEAYLSLREGLDKEYAEMLAERCGNYVYNMGFTHMKAGSIIEGQEPQVAPPNEGFTPDDAKKIADDWDKFFGGKA
jgi:hypothetical protein